jgi:hypothetical protein
MSLVRKGRRGVCWGRGSADLLEGYRRADFGDVALDIAFYG